MSTEVLTSEQVALPKLPRASRRLRWLKRLLPLITLLLLGAWFAPVIVAKTGLRNRVARQALADVRGSVQVGGASLSWFAPVELRDVVIKDEVGQTIVSAAKITSGHSLLALTRNRAEPGEFTIEGATIAVICTKNTTSIEGAFAEYLKESATPAPARVPLSVRIVGGTLTITDAETAKSASIDDINATVRIPANRAEPIALNLTAATGNINAEASIGDSSSAKLSSAKLMLDSFAPLLKRVDPGLALAGTVATDLRFKWSKDAKVISGTATGTQLALSAPWLNGDRLEFDAIELPLDVELAGQSVRVRAFDLRCDVGTLSVAGTFDADEPAEQLLARPGVVVNANIDVARLASKLPKLLHLKEGTELREGKLEVKLASKADASGTVWDGLVNTSSLKAVRSGKPFAWEQPLRIEFAGRYAKDQLPNFDKLICTSDFLAVNAKFTPETLQAAANVYLYKLSAHLAEFVDLGGFTLDGEAVASLVARREQTGKFNANSIIELKNFAFTDKSGKGLKEPALKLQIAATGTIPATGPVEFSTALLTLRASSDELHLSLLEPVNDVRRLTSGSVEVRIAGELERWKTRVAALTAIPQFALSGTIAAHGKVKLSAERITVDRLTVALTNPKLNRWITLDEPSMNAVGDFTFTRATNVVTIANLTLTSIPLSATGGVLTFDRDGAVSGNGQCSVDLNRLGKTVRLYVDANGPDALHGRGVGPLRFRTRGDATHFGGTLEVANFLLGSNAKPLWTEPTLRLKADGSYSDSADVVKLAVAKAERPGLALDAKGSVAKITTTQDANITGTLRYDWAKLSPLLRDAVGGNLTGTGTGTRTFALSGQLASLDSLNGEAALGWQSIAAYGFDIGSSELNAKMTRGAVGIAPLTASFGGGRVIIAPTLKLDPGEVTLAKGVVVDRAKLTPQATAGALGYALPAIANAGQAEGEISAIIDDNRIPLADFTRASFKGTLVIHKATVGLNPVGAQVANLLGAKATTMTLVNESAVPVQVANGRVHHQNFAVRISGTTFHTSGSVGFDDTLDLVVDVPLPKDFFMLKNNPVLMKAVAGKVIKVPLKGTLAKPTLDPKALNDAVIALTREAAKEVGKDVLEGELRKLFPGMPAPGTSPKGGPLPFPLPFQKKS